MANVFLSYDRDDRARALPIAALLERAGHSVWWDRQIKGGHEFGAEIEAALEAADKIVVLWSLRAVKSAWVRDEAAVGRDTGRLVPVTIDGTLAPLGFRQFQTIDLSHWRGRGSSPRVEELLNAFNADEGTVGRHAPSEPSRLTFRPGRRVLLGGAALLVIAAAGLLLWRSQLTDAGAAPIFAIVPADPSSAAQQAAHDLATRVAAFDDPASRRLQLIEAGSEAAARNAKLLLEVGSPAAGSQTRELRLVQPGDEAILWSTTLDPPGSQSANVAQQAAVEAQRVLSCANEAVSYKRERMPQDTLKLYLSGCVRVDNAYGIGEGDADLGTVFEQVVGKTPHFAPAWARLFAVEYEKLAAPDRDELTGKVREQLKRADALGIDIAETYAARAGLVSPGDFLSIFKALDEGTAKHPDSATLLRFRADRLLYVGRMNGSVNNSGRALQLDPMSPANWQTYASALAYAGDSATGYEQLRRAEQLWPDAPTVGMARYRLDLRFGDPREAIVLYRRYAQQTTDNPALAAFIEARIEPTPENVQRAIDAERKHNAQYPNFIASLVQALGQFGRKDEVIDLLLNYKGSNDDKGEAAEVLFRPAMRDVWRDPRSMAAAAHLGLLHYWKASGKWPDFCFDPTLPYDCKKEAVKYRD